MALRIENAANVVGLNVQFERSPTYVSIKNSENIYLNGVLAGNWNFELEATSRNTKLQDLPIRFGRQTVIGAASCLIRQHLRFATMEHRTKMETLLLLAVLSNSKAHGFTSPPKRSVVAEESSGIPLEFMKRVLAGHLDKEIHVVFGKTFQPQAKRGSLVERMTLLQFCNS